MNPLNMPLMMKLDEQAQRLWCDVYARVLVALPDFSLDAAAKMAREEADRATNSFFDTFDPSDADDGDDDTDEPNDLEDDSDA